MSGTPKVSRALLTAGPMLRVSAPVPRFTVIEESDPIARVRPALRGIQILRIGGAAVHTVGKVSILEPQDQIVGRFVSREADRACR